MVLKTLIDREDLNVLGQFPIAVHCFPLAAAILVGQSPVAKTLNHESLPHILRAHRLLLFTDYHYCHKGLTVAQILANN